MSIIGILREPSGETEAYARTNERVKELEDHAVVLNGEFDDTLGWWGQVQGGDKFDDTIIMHKRSLVENFNNKEVSPFMATQTVVDYSDNVGHNFTRMCNAYHELIGDGSVMASEDHYTPNFTAMGATCHNKFRGNVGMAAVIGRIEDVAYTDEELGIEENDTEGTTGMGSSKSCAGGFMATRRSNYSQGRHNASYSIGLETYTLNAAEEDGILGTEGYYQNDDFHRHRTWINGYHCVGGGRRPATDGILINGFTVTVPIDADGKTTSDSNAVKKVTMHNGFLNGITIGGSSMAVRHIVKVTNANGDVLSGYTTDGNSTETVGINTSSWSKSEGKNYGFYLLKHGYSGRILHSRGAALFDTPGTKYLNSNGNMPFAISANGVPYIDLKTGTDSNYYEDASAKKIPKERPDDITRARIGYNPSANYLNTTSDGDIRFVVNGTFTTTTNQSAEPDQDPTGNIISEDNSVIYKFQGRNFISSVTASTEETPLYANLGSPSYKWGNIYANNGTINTSDRNFKTDISDIDEKILKAWSKVNYKVFKFKGGNRKHIGVIAQDIDEAFKSEGLNARDFGLFCEDADESGNTTLGVRYSEVLALECAYLRSKIGA